MKNLYGCFFSGYGCLFSGIASQWDGVLEKQQTSYQNPILKLAMRSQIGLFGRKRSFQLGMGEHA
jgi:hypothetical protein